MPKASASPAPQDPLVDAAPAYVQVATVSGGANDPRVPAGLQGVFTVAQLPDGRWILPDLPPALFARYYPDLAPLADLPPPPTIAEV